MILEGPSIFLLRHFFILFHVTTIHTEYPYTLRIQGLQGEFLPWVQFSMDL